MSLLEKRTLEYFVLPGSDDRSAVNAFFHELRDKTFPRRRSHIASVSLAHDVSQENSFVAGDRGTSDNGSDDQFGNGSVPVSREVLREIRDKTFPRRVRKVSNDVCNIGARKDGL